MKTPQSFTAIIKQDIVTGYYVAHIPDLPGAHTQAETLEELKLNLQEVVSLVPEDSSGQLRTYVFTNSRKDSTMQLIIEKEGERDGRGSKG